MKSLSCSNIYLLLLITLMPISGVVFDGSNKKSMHRFLKPIGPKKSYYSDAKMSGDGKNGGTTSSYVPKRGAVVSNDDLHAVLELISKNPEKADISEAEFITMFESSVKNHNTTTSYAIFDEMLKRGVICTSAHMTALLSIAHSNGDTEKAYQLFMDAINLGMKPSVHNFSPLLKHSNSPSRTRELLQLMDFYGIEPNVISLTAAIRSCEPTGDWKFALELLDLMRAINVTPNEITYSCIISVASQGAAGEVAVNILREMQNNGVEGNSITYASTLVACARTGLWDDVDKLLNEMILLNIPITESILISVINVCREPSFHMNGKPIPNWKKAVDIRDKWAAKVPDASESLYTIVMDVCEGADQYNEVIATFKKMSARSIKGTRSSFVFTVRAAEKLKNSDIGVELLEDFR